MKTLAKVIAGLLVLLVIVVAGFLATFDPNDYRERIERLALEKGNVQLNIEGDIGWSLFPSLALKLPALTVRDTQGQPLAALDKAHVEVELLALLTKELKVSGLLIDGLELEITKPEMAVAADQASEAGAAEGAGPASPPALLLDVGSVEILNARITYRDPGAGQRLELTDFNLRADNLVTARLFPAQMAFELEVYEDGETPTLAVVSEFDGSLYLDLARQQYRAEDANLRLVLKGPAFGGKSVPLQLQGDLGVDLEADTLLLKEVSLTLANLGLNADLTANNVSGEPTLGGELTVKPFDLKKLLVALGQPPLETGEESALRAVAFKARIEGPPGVVGLKDLGLILDDSHLAGEARYTLDSGAIWLRLKGDKINLDRYLPPSEAQAAQPQTDAQAEPVAATPPAPKGTETEADDAPRYPKTPLFPVELLRTLIFDASVRLDEVRVAKMKLGNVALAAVAGDGKIEVSRVAGDLYQGSFNNNAVIDASGTPVTLTVNKDVRGVQLGGLLLDVLGKDLFSGRFDMDGQYRAQGNSIHAIVNSLGGAMKFNLQDGRLQGVNLTDQLCRGILRVQGKEPSPDAAENYTEFSNVTGSVTLEQGVAANRDLRASLVGISLNGEGIVDLPDEMLDYGLSLTILQELKGPNCQIDEKLHNVSLPLRCKGSFDEDPATLCRPDTERMKQAIASLYKEKAKAKVDAAKEEVKEKAKSKLEEKLQENDKVKDALRGLFNQ